MTREEMVPDDGKTLGERREEYKYSFYDDVSFVLNLMPHHKVLVVGGKTSFIDLNDKVASVSHVARLSALEDLLKNESTFDRVILHRDAVLSERMVARCVRLADGGLTCFFSDQPMLRQAFRDIVESCWLNANVWDTGSNIGPVVLTDASGNPSWMD